INYRDRKFNLFGNFSYSNARNFNNNNDRRYFYNKDESLRSFLQANSRYTWRSDAWNTRVGMDYFVSPKTTLGVMLTGTIRPKTDRLEYATNEYNDNMQLDSISTGYTDGSYHWKNGSMNLNFQHKFDSSGKTLTADMDYINYRSDSRQVSPNYLFLPDSNLSSSSDLLFLQPSNVNIWSVKADYTQPLKGKARFDAGFKSSYVTNDNQLGWYNRAGNLFAPDYSKSDHFIYRERINSAYLTVAKEWKRWAIQGGLRMENTQSKGHQLSNPVIADSAFTRRYSLLFPTLYTSYKLDSGGNNTLTLSYSRRVRRPGYQQLNPFLFYRDRYTYSSGNPGLLPEYGYYLDLRYNYKQYISVTLAYSWQQHLIYPTSRASGDLLITRPQNFSGRHSIGVIPNASFSPAKWWSVNLNALIIFFVNKSGVDSIQLPVNTNMHEVEVFNQFHFRKGWGAELTGFFPGRQSFGQSKSEGVYYNISAGIQKNILKSKGTLRLKMDDIFHTTTRNAKSVAIPQVTTYLTSQSDTRQLGLSFSYRFGKDINARKRNHNTGGAGDEEKRTMSP
ncbi:MAG TPA: outer membrane beta-barrel family protein, partial [Chitinophagaceae bacterium]|nr:outer membrane beta-barrel family protein [Chitinophagaceae bacterium]